MPNIARVSQDTIEFFEEIQDKSMQAILGMNAAEVVTTDLSQLSDFALSGDWEEDQCLTGSETLNEMYDLWDTWVIAKIRETYGVEVPTTAIKLTTLFTQISAPKPTLQ